MIRLLFYNSRWFSITITIVIVLAGVGFLLNRVDLIKSTESPVRDKIIILERDINQTNEFYNKQIGKLKKELGLKRNELAGKGLLNVSAYDNESNNIIESYKHEMKEKIRRLEWSEEDISNKDKGFVKTNKYKAIDSQIKGLARRIDALSKNSAELNM
jgi:hypothetical protein